MPTRYLFDQFAFATTTGLSRNGLYVHLQRGLHPVLLCLLEGGGAVVDRKSIAKACGNEVSEASVTQKVARLREALDDARGELIRTVYGKGFRVSVPVRQHDDAPAVNQMDSPSSSARPQGSWQAGTGEDMIRTAFELASQRSDERLKQASMVLELTLKSFPTFALAPSLQADVEVARMVRGYERPSSHADHVLSLVEKALALSPSMASALATKGWLLGAIYGDLPEGLRLLEAALAAAPQAWLASFYKVWLLVGKGEVDEAMRELQRSLAISPLERGLLSLKAWLLLSQGRTVDADAFLGEVLQLRPDVDLLWLMQSVLFVRKHRIEDALQSMKKASELNPDDTFIDAHQAWLLAVTGATASARDFVRRCRRPKAPYVSPVQLGMVHYALDDRAGHEAQRRVAVLDRDPWRLLSWCDPRLTAAYG